jgi:hypothetical protein
MYVQDMFTSLHEEYGWPSWLVNLLIALVVIIMGLSFGFVCIIVVRSLTADLLLSLLCRVSYHF